MANEFNIKNGFISNSDSNVIGTLSGNTMVLTSTPSNNDANTEILSRNSSTGRIEYINSSSVGSAGVDYGLSYAISIGNYMA